MAERSNAAVLKTVDGVTHPGVRIPLFPFFVSFVKPLLIKQKRFFLISEKDFNNEKKDNKKIG